MASLEHFLQDRAALYVAGTMMAEEREAFEVLLEFHGELRAQVAGLQDALATVALAQADQRVRPPAELKTRLLAAVAALPPAPEPEGWVVTDAAGLVQWVNAGFTAMCGYTAEELRGHKPGHLLQGPGTDRAAVERMRVSLQVPRACQEKLINYHKDGTAYAVDIRVAPILDDEGRSRWLVARERKLAMGEVAAH